jgi:hypothetical protein
MRIETPGSMVVLHQESETVALNVIVLPGAPQEGKPRRPQASPLFRLVSEHVHRLLGEEQAKLVVITAF